MLPSHLARTLPYIGIALMVGGSILLAALGWLQLNPPMAPFKYHKVAEGPPGNFPDLALEGLPDLTVGKYEVRVDDIEKPLAEFHIANMQSDPLLLSWQNHVTDFVLTTGVDFTEFDNVAKAVTKYVPKDALVLSWWDTSQRLKLLTPANVLFDENLATPLLIPQIWAGKRDSIEAAVHDFWNVPRAGKTAARFDAFADALLSDEIAGAEKLRRLAKDRETFLVVHLFDAFKLGIMEPDRLAIAYKDFSTSGKLHGQVRRIKDWAKKQGHEGYAVQPLTETTRRVLFLEDRPSTDTLIARLLPFNSSNPFAVNGFSLVYRHGGYWVYRLTDAADKESARSAAPLKQSRPRTE